MANVAIIPYDDLETPHEVDCLVRLKVSQDLSTIAFMFPGYKGGIPNILPFTSHFKTFKEFLSTTPRKGSIIEFGTAQGGTTRELARLAPALNIYTFDVMTGLDERDFNAEFDNRSEVGFGTWTVKPSQWLHLYPNVKFIEGRIEETLPKFAQDFPDEKFILAYVDVNTYKSTTEALDFLRNRMLPGGLIVIDDYAGKDQCLGAFKATNEFIEQECDRLCLRAFSPIDFPGECQIHINEPPCSNNPCV
jgi:hypothetical protein